MISHTSKTGSAIIFDSMLSMIIINGMADKKVIPRAANLLVFPIRLKTAAMIHIKTIETAAITAPMENTAFTLRKLLSKNK